MAKTEWKEAYDQKWEAIKKNCLKTYPKDGQYVAVQYLPAAIPMYVVTNGEASRVGGRGGRGLAQ